MQYEKWKTIRQNDPAKAADIARIVLERHEYVTGKIPASEEGRKHFNLLTDRLKNEGINLYNSHQFRDPIFKEPDVVGMPAIQTVKKQDEVQHPVESLKTSSLRQRFANRDCFEFLAGILEDNGISYYGSNGVGNALIDHARIRGMNSNAFLTGEGVTRLLCDKPFEINITETSDA